MPLALVVGGELVEELVVELHERLEDAVDERDDRLVPVLLRDAVERWEHDGQHHVAVLLDQRHDVLVVPVVERPLGHLSTQPRYTHLSTQPRIQTQLQTHAHLHKRYAMYMLFL